ncbi:biotin-dependent carboxyltransferase family protein [Cognatishimia sp. WU-CL00825]|uniref:5-oxoprolinase subunit C family protein n=1 Tax=Cognatishimia sp. WU-CL00825 TaxID=3127658 RepID=UPI0031071456
MSAELFIKQAGPALSIQDLGRSGHIAQGVSRGGAMDRLALLEATALLSAVDPLAAIEMAGLGGTFNVSSATRFALTGAPMRAHIDGVEISWNGTHRLEEGQELRIGSARQGVYGYLTFAGQIDTPEILGSRAAHLNVGLGATLKPDDVIPLCADPDQNETLMCLPSDPRFQGGVLRVMNGPQTELFSIETRQSLCQTQFVRSNQANRQGIRLDHPTERFQSDLAAALASDFVLAGDIQLTGEGIPYVLMAECQTVGGYPRIGTIIPQDLPKLAQAPAGTRIQLQFLPENDVQVDRYSERRMLAKLRALVTPRIRDPKRIQNLLSYQLISGVTAGDDLERTE